MICIKCQFLLSSTIKRLTCVRFLPNTAQI
nr:MAG TPA: hypothetical protein [Caudoviricetes sp.]